MEDENKLNLYSLTGLKPNNVKEIFEKNFNRWRYFNSSEVIVDGKKIDKTERILLFLPDKDGKPNIKNCIISDTTINGFPLTKETFIDEERKKYEPLYKQNIGSKKNREQNLKLKIYLDYLNKTKIMSTHQNIKGRIKSLFQFIDFLYSNIDNFKQYDNVIKELDILFAERANLKHLEKYSDKLKYDEIQVKIEQKIKIIKENIIQLIKSRVIELNICDWNDTGTLWNYNISEVNSLKENFNSDDIPEILQHKNKYIEFRIQTNCTYFQNFFFSDLDEILKSLFDFFKESEKNEFEPFETKPIIVNSVDEIAEIVSGENKHSHCKPSHFKHDISELCDNCPLTDQIKKAIVDKIELKAKEQQEILLPEQFKEYLNNEIQNAQKAMEKAKSAEENTDINDYHRHNRIELYIWNKERIKKLNEFVKSLPSHKHKNTPELIDNKKPKFIAKEYALAYIFDLDAIGEQIPMNRIEGGYDAKELKRIGKNKGFDKPDTFYRAVIEVCKFDRNNLKELQNISKDWYNAVKMLSTNWTITEHYLIEKKIIKE